MNDNGNFKMRPRTIILACCLIATLILGCILLIEYIQLSTTNSEISKTNAAETVFLEPLNWQFERPDVVKGGFQFNFDEIPNSPYYSNVVSGSYFDAGTISESVFIDNTRYGSLYFFMNITVDLSQGFVQDVDMVTFNSFPSSHFTLGSDMDKVLENLTESNIGSRTLILANAVNHPRRVSMWLNPHLSLSSPDDQTEYSVIYTEVRYFNGTSYKNVIRPFNLTLIAYNNTSFESAEELEPSANPIGRIGGYGRTESFYKIHLRAGETTNVTMTPASESYGDFLYLYGPENLTSPMYFSGTGASGSYATLSIVFTAGYAGWWYVKVFTYYAIYFLDCVKLSP